MSRRTDFNNVAIIFYGAEAGQMTTVPKHSTLGMGFSDHYVERTRYRKKLSLQKIVVYHREKEIFKVHPLSLNVF